jgi:hypothetical protein
MDKLYLVESPFQFLNALEAQYKFGKGRFLIRFSGREINDKQLRNIIYFFNIKNFEEVTINYNKGLFDFIKLIYFKFKSFKESQFFIGNLESKFFNLFLKKIKRENIILMDDGAKTIYLQNSFNDRNFYNLFTMFNLKPLKNQLIYINNFDYLKSKIKASFCYNNETVFIGSKLSEDYIISESEYLEILYKLAKKYKNITYIPHREESHKKLEKIFNLGIKIRKMNLPIEFIGIEESIPKKVISFYSTALISLKRIYEIDSSFIKLNLNNNLLKQVYDYYQMELKEEKI